MSFILDTDTSNVESFTSVPTGEYELRIVKAESKNSQKGDPMLAVQMDIPSESKSKDVFHYIMLPTGNDDVKRSTQKLVNLKDFKAAFGFPQSGPISTDEMEGARGWAILVEEDDQQYGKANRVKRFIAGR
jgi:hypothetical protein